MKRREPTIGGRRRVFEKGAFLEVERDSRHSSSSVDETIVDEAERRHVQLESACNDCGRGGAQARSTGERVQPCEKTEVRKAFGHGGPVASQEGRDEVDELEDAVLEAFFRAERRLIRAYNKKMGKVLGPKSPCLRKPARGIILGLAKERTFAR